MARFLDAAIDLTSDVDSEREVVEPLDREMHNLLESSPASSLAGQIFRMMSTTIRDLNK